MSDLFNSNVVKRKLVSEWNGISASVFCLMARGGEDTGDHFTIFLILTRCPNTRLFKDEKSMLFYDDYLTHPINFSTTFDSKRCVYLERHCNDLEISNFAATIMDIAYGIEVQESGDSYISLVEEVLEGGAEASIPGAFWVDLFPILAYVPSWFPGAGFQKKAAHWRKLNKTLVEKPFRYVQDQLVGESFS